MNPTAQEQTTGTETSPEASPLSSRAPADARVQAQSTVLVAPTANESASEMHVPATIRQALYGLFLWCLLGIALAYGMRLWNDSPVHPSFIPFVGIAFCAILAFTVVMAFRSVSGEVDFEFGSMKFKGASGPVLFWSICFLTVAYGMYLLGITDVAKSAAPIGYKSCSAREVAMGTCWLQELDKAAARKPSEASSATAEVARRSLTF
ncbi:hypothetical protein BH11PSE10_BH11PSE10_12120 [soil metagenome]